MTFPFVLAQAEGESGTGAEAVGWVIFALLLVAFAAAVFLNARKGRAEVGSELELAANRRPYLSDEELETKKLDRTLFAGLILLGVVAVALPLYWLGEPSRQENAVANFEQVFINRGEALYNVGANCAACHGPEGVGGVASRTLLTDRGEFDRTVTWQAPALDTVLFRYSYDEVFEILQYGRPNTPMPAWGSLGGGPLTDQQLRNIISYLESIQLPAEEARAAMEEELATSCGPDEEGVCQAEDAEFETEGEALFNMGLTSGFQGGAYSCGRCHTKGWSYGDPQVPGGGALGPAINGGATLRQFPSAQSQIDFISQGAEKGKPYGVNGQADDGTMPGFGVNPNTLDPATATLDSSQVMYTQDQIAAVVDYERGL